MKFTLYIILILLFYSCVEQKTETLSAQSIIDKSIEVSGSHHLSTSRISFDFRDKHYTATRNRGSFELTRQFRDSTKTVKDVLSNIDFRRTINAEMVHVADSMISKFSASVNSVHYFSVLPFGLNDAAVTKELLKEVSIENKNYHTIKITFKAEGGGEDFEDEFLYWINAETFKVDYLAYSYKEEGRKGFRFRQAYNERIIKGIRFVDYNNYKAKNEINKLSELPEMFENGELELLSKIQLKNVEVTLQK